MSNVPACAVSGSAVVPPPEIVTHTPPVTLVAVQPVWYAIGIPPAAVVVPVIL